MSLSSRRGASAAAGTQSPVRTWRTWRRLISVLPVLALMRVRALLARPDARSRPRWRRWLLIVGDAALALALAAVFYLATAVHYQNRPVGIALILLQTLPLAFRRWRPVWVLAVVVAATLGTMAAEISGRSNGGVGVVLLVALYSVAAHCPRRQAAWAGIASRGRPGLAALERDRRYRPGQPPGRPPVPCADRPGRGAQPGFPGACVAVRRLHE